MLRYTLLILFFAYLIDRRRFFIENPQIVDPEAPAADRDPDVPVVPLDAPIESFDRWIASNEQYKAALADDIDWL